MKAIQRQGGDTAGVIGEDIRETLRDTHSGKMDNTRPTSKKCSFAKYLYFKPPRAEIPNPIQLNPIRTHLTKTKLR